MKISYSLTFKEYCRYQILLLRRLSRTIPWLFYLPCALLVLILCLPAGLDYYLRYIEHLPTPAGTVRDDLILLMVPLLVAPVGMTLSMLATWLFFYRRLELQIDPEGIAHNQRWIKTRFLWPAIDLVDQDEGGLLFGSKAVFSGRSFFAMVPRRAFASPDEARGFFEQALAYWRAALPSVDPPNSWPPAPKT